MGGSDTYFKEKEGERVCEREKGERRERERESVCV